MAYRWAPHGLGVGLREGFLLEELKTTRSRRDLPIPSLTLEALRRRSSAHKAEKMKHRDVWQEPLPGLVFETMTGSPLDSAQLRRTLRSVCTRARVKAVHPYALRHSAASFQLLADVPMRVVMENLGHSTIALTANTYSHVAPQLQVDAAQRVNALLSD